MIYTKTARFPYPFFNTDSVDYNDAKFSFNISLNENSDEYIFDIEYIISSIFINNLIENKKADMVLVIKSKDNQFYYLDKGSNSITIPKSKLSLYKNKTNIQLMIICNEDISFSNNTELSEFYSKRKSNIKVKRGSALGFSNVMSFDGTQENPFNIFHKKLNKQLGSEIKIEMSEDYINIVYRDEDTFFDDIPKRSNLINMYLYQGLKEALVHLIINHTSSPLDGIQVSDLNSCDLTKLDEKLITILEEKKIKDLHLENLDEVIYKITNGMISKFINDIRRLNNDN